METLASTSKILSSSSPPSSSSSTSLPPSSKKPCQYCPTIPSKYTCPRCHIPTCSLSCTQTHKKLANCSGIRDKATYIPLNKYGWGSMMDDYCFLEDVGRKVGEVGREIVRGGFDMKNVVSSTTRGGSRGREGRGGRGGGRGGMVRRGGGKGKREMLKMHLERRGIEMELLPNGMERRQLNHSFWDQKNQTALLTIQFKFHPSAEARSSFDTAQTFTLLTHRNNISTPLLTLVQTRVRERINRKPTTSTDAFPPWISSLLIPPPEDPENFTMPTFVLSAPSDPALLARPVTLPSSKRVHQLPPHEAKVYYSLDPNEPLVRSLSGTQFVEFPLIEVWEEFNGVVVDKKTGSTKWVIEEQGEPQRKRRKLNVEEGLKTIHGLLGDYGSGSEDEEEGQPEDHGSPLVRYAESEGGGDDTDTAMEREDNGADEGIPFELNEAQWSDADAEGEIDLEADPAILLELMRQAKQEGKWIEEDDDIGDESDDPCE